jgi:hypothetical protein
MTEASDPTSLVPVARLQALGRHYIKAKWKTPEGNRIVLIPASVALKDDPLKKFLADRLGLADDNYPSAEDLRRASEKVPSVIGLPRLGWTDDATALLYGGEVLSGPRRDASISYELFAPKDTLLGDAVDAFRPKGSREEQYRGFRELWSRSEEFKLVLALACISPFLEIMGAPSIAFHLAGPTGIGKTTLLRFGISVFANPSSPLTCVDFSKDTANFADAQLGLLHNFPILLDETTTQQDPKKLAELFYGLATGHTKGRLGGPDQGYLPVKPLSYTLVSFLSGEASLRENIELRGATARILELVADEPLLPRSELSVWRSFADTHYGWFGQDLLKRQIGMNLAGPVERAYFKNGIYAGYRRLTGQWCSDHSRTLDALTAIQIGYRMAATLLGVDASLETARTFAQVIEARLNKTLKLDHLLEGLSQLPNAEQWAERGFIPCDLAAPIGREFGFLDNKSLLAFLRSYGIAKKIEPRTIQGPEYAGRSVRCYILTPDGKARLSAEATRG